MNGDRPLGSRGLDRAVFDPACGIVSSCFQLPTEPDDPRVFCWVSEATRTSRFGDGVPDCARFGCGVGVTPEQAQGAAVGEIAERYSAAFYDPDALISASFTDLGEPALRPESFALFASWQDEPHVPRPFTAATRTSWVRGFDLTNWCPVLVPAPFVYLPYLYRSGEPFFVDCFSTGLACSRSRDDATLRALCEVVERDALSILWHAALVRPRLRLDSDSEVGRLFQERFTHPGIQVFLIDATLDIGIPVVIAILLFEQGGVVLGSACRLDPGEAARKALLEAAQSWIVWKREIVGGPRQSFAEDFNDVLKFADHPRVYLRKSMRRHLEFLWSSPEQRAISHLPDRASGDPRLDLATCLELLRQVGLSAVAVDVTSEDLRRLGYWVVRVVVPELQRLHARHDAPLLGGERLLQVPWKMGWRTHPLRPDELNRTVHPFP